VIVICFHYNPLAALIFFINSLLSALFAVFLTHLLYMGLMKIMSGERFKDIIAWFQIAITIFMMGGYQIMIRLVGKLEHVNLGTGNWWIHLLPPSWMAGSNELFVSFHITSFSVISLLLSILIPLGGLWFVVKVLAPGYTAKLAVMEQGDLMKVTEHSDKAGLSGILARVFTRTNVESAVFQAVWKIAGRDRKFKQTVYPMLGSIFVMLFIFGFSGKSTIYELATTKLFLVLLYLPLFYLFIICISLKYSDNYRSAWIYKVIPVEQPGAIVSASIKAITLKLFVPVYLLCNGIMIYFQGIGFIFQIITGLMISLTGLLFILSLFRIDLPFSADPLNRYVGGNMLLTFILLPLGGVMAGLHYLLIYFHIPMALVSLGTGLLCWFVFRRFRKTRWNKIEAIEV
jgi:ABC-2 type transport system permease protein